MNAPQVAFACRCFGQAEVAVRAAVGYLLEAAGNSIVSKVQIAKSLPLTGLCVKLHQVNKMSHYNPLMRCFKFWKVSDANE